jgi:hypothetical protein
MARRETPAQVARTFYSLIKPDYKFAPVTILLKRILLNTDVDDVVRALQEYYGTLAAIIRKLVQLLNTDPYILIGVSLWITGNDYVYKYLTHDDLTKYQKIIIWTVMNTDHSIVIIYNTTSKRAFIVDPHGDDGEYDLQATTIFTRMMLREFKVKIQVIPMSLSIIQQEQQSPVKSHYRAAIDPEGYCMMWSILIVHMALLHRTDNIGLIFDSIKHSILKSPTGSYTVFIRNYYYNWIKVLYRISVIGINLGYDNLKKFVKVAPDIIKRCVNILTCYNKLKQLLADKTPYDLDMLKPELQDMSNMDAYLDDAVEIYIKPQPPQPVPSASIDRLANDFDDMMMLY